MARYLLTYDLNRPGQEYARLIQELESFSARRVLFSTWVFNRINTNAEGMRDYFWQFMDQNDRLLVIDFTDQPWASNNTMTNINEV